jgi:hypothetical protein
VVELVSKANALVHERDKLRDERAAERRRLLEINSSSHSSNSEEATTGSDGCDGIDEKNGDEATSGPKPPQLAPGFNIWWDSMCAQRLFNSSKERETVVDRFEDLIVALDNKRKQTADTGHAQTSRNCADTGHAQRAGIALTYEKCEIIQGWEGTPRGWNRFFGNEGGLNQPTLAKCTRPMVGQRIRWELCAVRKDTDFDI